MNDDKVVCRECGKPFASQDALIMHKSSKHPSLSKAEKASPWTKLKLTRLVKIGSLLIGFAAIGYWLIFLPHYEDPPFEYRGQPHPETHPSSFFLDEPIPLPVQVHILEHGPNNVPGALAQYNCIAEEDSCKKLVCDLRELVSDFDSRNPVYVAPYYRVNALIVLTGRGKIEKMDAFDESGIRAFFSSIGVGD